MAFETSFKTASANPTVDATGLRNLAKVINNIMRGRINSLGEVTLNTGQVTTLVTNRNISINSVVPLMPTTANAAAAVATTFIVTNSDGTFTINHASNAQTDRTFRFTILG